MTEKRSGHDLPEVENSFKNGVADGLPISLGYVAVSFAFGMMAVSMGIPWHIALLISVTNVTSAGQFAGIGILAAGGSVIEMALTQFVINLRYMLMSLTVSTRLHESVTAADRWLIGFGMTDEIFGVSAGKPSKIGRKYMLGLIPTALFGWCVGTLLGAVAGTLLPENIRLALQLALYGMFIAIVVPPAKKDRNIAFVVFVALACNCFMLYIPALVKLFESSAGGFVTIISASLAAAVGALVNPVRVEQDSAA